MVTLGDMSVPEQDEEFRRIMSRLDKTEALLFGGLDNPNQGIFHLVTQLTQAVASQGIQINNLQQMMRDELAKKMDVVIDEMNQPISISLMAHDLSEIRKLLQRVILWLAGIGAMGLLVFGRTLYAISPSSIQDVLKH